MLKASKAVPVSRAPPPKSHGLLLDSELQRPANPSPQSGFPDKWHAYVNGGAKQDDARMLQIHKEENATFEEQRHNSTPRPAADRPAAHAGSSGSSKLIETSPQKPAPSVYGNTGLLLDLDINSTYEAHPQHPSRASYASAVQSKKKSYGGSQFNLLD
jgi:helicase required for RNAi-mediated heterochromatin assembly 1